MTRDTAPSRGNGRAPRATFLPGAGLAAATLLGVVTWQVLVGGDSLYWDVLLGDAIRAWQSDFLTRIMLAAHAVQGGVIAGSILVLLLDFAARRQWGCMLLLLATVPGGMVVNSAVKLMVHRPRPLLPAAVGAHGYAFPSGHVVAITLLGAYLVFETCRRTPSRSWRLGAGLVGAAAVSIVALSRVYLGVHQPSDVVAAVLLGVAWMALCAWVADKLYGRHAVDARQADTVEPGGASAMAVSAASSTTR